MLTLVLSVLLGTILGFVSFLPFFLSLLLLLAIISVGIFFDMVGVAVAASQEKPLHAMGADRVAGSGQALWLVRRAERVTNICNDVIGDVSGTIGGALTASLAVALAVRYGLDRSILSILAIALTAALTVGGKAAGKVYALRYPHHVILAVGRGLSWLGWPGTERRSRARRDGRRKPQGRR